MVAKKQVLEKLSEVMDPEFGMSIVDLGFIYEVKESREKNKEGGKSSEKQTFKIKMTFTTPACPLMNEMLNEMKTKLEEFKDADFDIEVVFDPPWSMDMLSEKAKIKLGFL